MNEQIIGKTDSIELKIHHIIQIWTGYECNSAKYMPEGVRVDDYFPRPQAEGNSRLPELPRAYILYYCTN